MKKLGLLFLGLLCFSGCQVPETRLKFHKEFQGEHKLRKMFVQRTSQTESSASFFLIVGDFHQKTTVRREVQFAWQMMDGAYALSTVPLNKVRIKPDASKKEPTISLNYDGSIINSCTGAWEYLAANLGECVNFITINVRDEDWPLHIELPLNDTQPITTTD